MNISALRSWPRHLAVLRQFATFAIIGAVGTLAHFAALIVGVQLLQWAPVLATSIGAVCGALVNYLLNYRLTFRSRLAHATTLSRFLIVAGVGMLVNALTVAVGVHVLLVNYLWAQLAATGLVLLLGFIANRAWTFKAAAP